MTDSKPTDDQPHRLTAEIVAAYVGQNIVSVDDLPALVATVHRALTGTKAPESAVALASATPTPAVPVKKSVRPDQIVCLECGKPLAMLKRHLRSDHDLTRDAYRAKWNLPSDYPMVAPNYAAKRSKLALAVGLGRRRTAA
ncbi:MAG: MucR family transcriptional regulator [Alphaproteobacteria bacterium]|nr:MucR family transcriptional regulator [Alphaproteobacteria bacterium]